MTSVPRCGLPGTNFERTFIAIKPDGVQRGKCGDIIARFENKGYKLVAMKMLTPTKELAEGHYSDLSSKPFFGGLVSYFASGPIVAMCWEGVNAIAQGRMLLGATNPKDSLPGTIRGDLCVDIGRNICHGSDGPESAKKEIEFWFTEAEVCDYTSHSHKWVYEKGAAVKPAGAGGGGDNKKEKAAPAKKGSNKKGGDKKAAAPAAAAAGGLDPKRKNACLKEGGKKGQDLAGMASFGCHFHLTSFAEPKGEMEYLKLCMQGANAEVDPEAEDRKGGAGDIGKIFVSCGETNLSVMCHVPPERTELTVDTYFAPVLAKLGNPPVTKLDAYTQCFEIAGNPDKDLFPMKLHDLALSAGFDFLREKGLILDDDSDDDVNFADECGIDLNAGADKSDY